MSTPAPTQTSPRRRAAAMRALPAQLTFLTPAFLGDAGQNARWRTPPIKHLLREWWRVAYAADKGFIVSVADMRREEGLLFGNAWLDNEYRKSQVRIRLDRWTQGTLVKAQWPVDVTVTHPNRQGNPVPVGSALYLGFGPLVYDKAMRRTTLKANAAIQAGEAAAFSIAVPEEHAPLLQRVLWLMDRYGTLGGRSRNGWGSFTLTPINGTPKLGGQVPLREWRTCLHPEWDWPHAIGQDEKGSLIWQTLPHEDWKSLMRTLAIVKIGLRTQFAFATGKNAPRAEERHWLSYPVTNHSVAAWGSNLRLPNQLRFKVRRTENGELVGVIFHMPHLPPAAFNPNRSVIECVWRCVHAFLDALKHAPNVTWPPCACLDKRTQEDRTRRLSDWWAKVGKEDRERIKLIRADS